MRRCWKIAGLLLILFTLMPLKGQLVVSLTFNRRRYMIYEQIFACVTVRNDSGRPLLFGKSPELTGFLLFDIRDERKRMIGKRQELEISTAGLFLGPGEVKRLIVPVSKYYDMSKPGTYFIHAYVSHNQLSNEFRSASEMIKVDNGAIIWEKKVGVPDPSGDNRLNKERSYSIWKFEGDNHEKYYYLRVEDNNRIYAVTMVGTVFAHMKYEVQVDMLSRIHLLMPVAPRIFHYMSFSADGTCLENSYWRTSGTIPMLYRNPQTGKVIRMGGVKAQAGVDFEDPDRKGRSASDLMRENDQVMPPTDSGLLDLGAGSMPTKSADED